MDQDVSRLKIPMNDSLLIKFLETHNYILEHNEGISFIYFLMIQEFLQIPILTELSNDVDIVAGFYEVYESDYVGMVELF